MVEPSDDSMAREEAPQQLNDDVDRLLDDVDALTEDLLQGSPAPPTADPPQTDPAAGVVPDDVGLASESALVQDGQRVGIDEIVADVDLALDKANRDLAAIVDPIEPSGDAAAPLDAASLPDPAPQVAPDDREPESANVPVDDPNVAEPMEIDSRPPSDDDAAAEEVAPADDSALQSPADAAEEPAPPEITEKPQLPSPDTQLDPQRAGGGGEVNDVLDELERMIAEAESTDPSNDTPTPDVPDAASQPEDVLIEMEQLKADAEALTTEVLAHADADQTGPTEASGQQADPPAPAAATKKVDRELDRLEDLLDDLDRTAGEQSEGDADPAAMIAPTPDAVPQPPAQDAAPEAEAPQPQETVEHATSGTSASEQQLDAELDALLSNDLQEAPAVAPEPEPQPVPEVFEQAPQPTPPEIDLESLGSISVLRLIKIRVRTRISRWIERSGPWIEDRLLALFELIDRPFRRLSTRTKELIGYCALGTLAMSIVALLIALVF